MRRAWRMALVAMVAIAGVAAGGAAVTAAAPVAWQADPFDTARWHIGAKQRDEALTIIDSGAFDINQQTEEGYTLLHYAAEAGDLELIKAMLARGADPNLKSNSPPLTPYQMAYSTLVKAELRKAMAAGPQRPGAGGAPAAGQSGGTPGGTGMCAMVRAEQVNDGRSPAERPFLKAKDAVWYNHPDELTGLIEDCVNVNAQDQYGWTLLHQAADRDRVAIARILLDHGASRGLRNKDGQTAAQLATSAEMKALLGPAGPAAPAPAASGRDKECQQKYQADVALCSDSTCRMRSNRKWQQCLKTGNYW